MDTCIGEKKHYTWNTGTSAFNNMPLGLKCLCGSLCIFINFICHRVTCTFESLAG